MTHPIGLNLIFLVPGETGGMEVYARELITELKKIPGYTYTAFINQETSGNRPAWLEGMSTVTVPVRARNRVSWMAGELLVLPRLATRAGIRLLHSIGNTGPWSGSFFKLVTIHDMLNTVHPESHRGIRGWGMRRLLPLTAKYSDHVHTISMASAQDIQRLLHLPAGKISMITSGPGADPTFAATPAVELRRRYELDDRPLIFTTSAKRPHKNLIRLLEAMALFSPEERPQLILPGYHSEHEQELKKLSHRLGLDGDVRFPGWISQDDLEGFYQMADLFIFPSLYEGFGLPVLEAMRRGLPVACSRGGALEETAGDAALIFDPLSPKSIQESIQKLLKDPLLRESLVRKGKLQAMRFDWKKTATEMTALYDRLLRSQADVSEP